MDYYDGITQLFQQLKADSGDRLSEDPEGKLIFDGQPLGFSPANFIHRAEVSARPREMLILLARDTLIPLSEQGIPVSDEVKQLLLGMGESAFGIKEHFDEWSGIVSGLGEQVEPGGTAEAPVF